ncbi:MAG: hypothetical protein IJV00_04645 [Clostridia bacterium]|nr:hypothetical protein [Clostridia bacterium]
MLGFSIAAFIFAVILFSVGLLMRLGKLDFLKTYHTNADRSAESHRKWVARSLMFDAVPAIACGVIAFFAEPVEIVIVTFAALVISVIPIAVVGAIFNK